MWYNNDTITTIMALMMIFIIVFVDPIYKMAVRVLKPVIIEAYVIGVGIKTRYQEWNRKVPYSEYILLEQRLIE